MTRWGVLVQLSYSRNHLHEYTFSNKGDREQQAVEETQIIPLYPCKYVTLISMSAYPIELEGKVAWKN